MTIYVPKLAQGDGNMGGLTYLHLISPPKLKAFSGGIKLEWNPFVSLNLDGVDADRELGLPWAAWIFYRLTRPEFKLLYNYGPRVTVSTYDTLNEVWVVGQGDWKRPVLYSGNATQDLEFWLNARFEIRQIEVLT